MMAQFEPASRHVIEALRRLNLDNLPADTTLTTEDIIAQERTRSLSGRGYYPSFATTNLVVTGQVTHSAVDPMMDCSEAPI
jgi:hypothetical protein